MPKSSPEERLPEAASASDDDQMVEELPDDATLIMEVLFDIRKNTDLIIDLLVEDDGEEEEAGDAWGARRAEGSRGGARPEAARGNRTAQGRGGPAAPRRRALAPELQ